MESRNAETVRKAVLIALSIWGPATPLARGQSGGTADHTTAHSTPPSAAPRSRPIIPPPRRFVSAGLRRGPVASASATSALFSAPLDRPGAAASASSLTGPPQIAPLPGANAVPDESRSDTVAEQPSLGPSTAPLLPAAHPIDANLIPGRTVEPIDLGSALRLVGGRDLDIAVARQSVLEAAADLSAARALWLPSLFYGPVWYRADGQIQTVTGQVRTIDRSGLFLGATGALANSFQGPPPGTGIPSLNGLSATLRVSDAIFEPMAARRVLNANRAGVTTAINNSMLQSAEAYFRLQGTIGRLAIAREAAANAEALSSITGAYARMGQGVEADYHRSLTELNHRQKEAELATGQVLVASADLVRLLVLDPRMVLAPVEPPECIIRLIPDDVPLDDLLVQGLRHRPELASAQEMVEAALLRWKQAKWRPFAPSIGATYSGGGYGGGQNAFFGNFGPRGDAVIGLFWELRNLGFTDLAMMRRRDAEHETAALEKVRMETQVGFDVVAAYETRQAASRQIERTRKTLEESIKSFQLNMVNIREGAGLERAPRPIEVLQPIQALAQSRLDYLDSVLGYNRAQFQLQRAVGERPRLGGPPR